MEDNRFMRAYNEFKREQAQERLVRHEPNNRFACLVEDTGPPKREPSRFDCLVERKYESYPRREYSGTTTYLPRISEPRESVNERMKRYKEEQAKKPPSPPEFSLKSEFHFPELVKSDIKENLKMPEATIKKEMIVNEIIVPNTQAIFTSLSWHNGKLRKKEIYEDGTEVEDDKPRVVVKKPVYTSWSSVVKSNADKIIYYDTEDF